MTMKTLDGLLELFKLKAHNFVTFFLKKNETHHFFIFLLQANLQAQYIIFLSQPFFNLLGTAQLLSASKYDFPCKGF
jgi:hypothetical protein